MNRRGFLAVSGFAGALALCADAYSKDSAKARRKNVLFIAVDDLRPELGCYGHPIVKSPNIDALAAGGVLFERAYCQEAICAATRASLLTGKRPDTTKVYSLSTRLRKTLPDVVTIPELFMKHGYFTEGIGKILHHEDGITYSVPHHRQTGAVYADKKTLEQYQGHKARKDAGEARKRGVTIECADVPDSVYEDGSIAQMAVDALNRLALKAKAKDERERQPFFLCAGFMRPHLPFACPKKYWDLYDRSKIPLPYPHHPRNAPEIAFTPWGQELKEYSDIPNVGPLDDAKTRELIHGYYACTSFTDAQIGKVLAELDKLDLRKDTIVALWGDHGWKLGEYSEWCKFTNFELDVHVPLILADPDYPGGIRVPALTEFVDIYPTLVELCGLPVPEDLEGVSMVPLLSDAKRPWKKAVFSQYPHVRKRTGEIVMGYSIRTDRYRYTEWMGEKTGELRPDERELYDLKNDPLCKENIAFKPESGTLVAQLHEMLKAGWQQAKP